MTNKIGQLLFIGIRGKNLTPEEVRFITEHNIGGVILFARNIGSPEQVHALCTHLQSLRHQMPDKLPLFIGVDQEGGRVARLKKPFTEWPPVGVMGKLDSTSVAFKFAFAMGTELRAVGINLDFAPSVDVLTNSKNQVIGDRALSSDPEIVAKLASALVRGYIKSGIIPCAKHFPGHGNTLIDSHESLPIEDATLERLRDVELVPFKKVFRARLDMVMTAHIQYQQIDPEWPATLSQKFVGELLRGELRYRGLVVTDDLDMGALAKNYATEEIPVRALEVGCDLLLYCNNFDIPPRAIQSILAAIESKRLTAARIEESYQRVIALKADVLKNPDPVPLSGSRSLIGHADHQRLSDAIRAGAVPADLLAT